MNNDSVRNCKKEVIAEKERIIREMESTRERHVLLAHQQECTLFFSGGYIDIPEETIS